MEKTILLSISYEELALLIRDSLRAELQNSIEKFQEFKKDDDKLLTIEDVQKYFNVSKCTIHEWKKLGLLPFHKMNRRLYFKKRDLLNALKPSSIKRFTG